ncbi:MAG: ATP-binding protein [Candidatus Sumerlaeia bacterium]|nr:ATP-binding protein [Candidatus Sumerlaeia bacterium]
MQRGVPAPDSGSPPAAPHSAPPQAPPLRYFALFALAAAALLSLFDLRILPAGSEPYPSLERLLLRDSFLGASDESWSAADLERELRLPPEDLAAAERVLAASRNWLGLRGRRTAGMRLFAVEALGLRFEFGHGIVPAAAAGLLAGAIAYLFARLRMEHEVAEREHAQVVALSELQRTRISELVETNRKLNAMQAKLVSQQRLASIGRLSATLAHEIRNPLGVIRSSAQVIAEEVSPGSSADVACDIIEEEAVRLNNIITDLLNYSSRKQPRISPQELNGLLLAWLAPLTDQYARNAVRVTHDFALGVDEVMIDPDQLYQAVLNVLSNARDALLEKGGGRIHVATRQPSPLRIELSVQDDGPGMPPVVLQQAQEPFYTTKPKGTGLGLAVCRLLVDRMGGSFEIASEPGKGTRVLFGLATVRGYKALRDSGRMPGSEDAEQENDTKGDPQA